MDDARRKIGRGLGSIECEKAEADGGLCGVWLSLLRYDETWCAWRVVCLVGGVLGLVAVCLHVPVRLLDCLSVGWSFVQSSAIGTVAHPVGWSFGWSVGQSR